MTQTTRLCIFGSAGRMGQRLLACAAENPLLEVVATIDVEGQTGDVAASQVIVDFSLPSATEKLLKTLKETQAGLVTGVTGRQPKEESLIQAESVVRPIFRAANFSLGVAVLNQLVAQAVSALGPDFDAEVFEIHHRLKADAPSGTALQLASTAASAAQFPWPASRRNRDGHTGPRGHEEIGTAALRGGTVAGEHTVFLFGQSERIELTHRATGRDVFALGALRAAAWLTKQPNGDYGMTDLITTPKQ